MLKKKPKEYIVKFGINQSREKIFQDPDTANRYAEVMGGEVVKK